MALDQRENQNISSAHSRLDCENIPDDRLNNLLSPFAMPLETLILLEGGPDASVSIPVSSPSSTCRLLPALLVIIYAKE